MLSATFRFPFQLQLRSLSPIRSCGRGPQVDVHVAAGRLPPGLDPPLANSTPANRPAERSSSSAGRKEPPGSVRPFALGIQAENRIDPVNHFSIGAFSVCSAVVRSPLTSTQRAAVTVRSTFPKPTPTLQIHLAATSNASTPLFCCRLLPRPVICSCLRQTKNGISWLSQDNRRSPCRRVRNQPIRSMGVDRFGRFGWQE